MRGRPRKPTHLKVLQGTYRPDRAPKNELQPDPVMPSCPRWLHPEAKREWRRIAKEYEKLGILTRLDRAALMGYCIAYGTVWEAERAIQEHGMVQYTETGYATQRPEVGIRNTALKEMRAFANELGMSPAARTRIDVSTTPKQEADTAADFLFGGRKRA